jgi:four helix bundle protein
MHLALVARVGAKNLDELRAYQRAREFKLEVYRLIDGSPQVQSDWKFRSQLADAAASNEMNIREGFRRFGAGEMAQFLSFALSSLAEALGWLQDGIDRRYFRKEDCVNAFALGEASYKTTLALHASLRPFFRRNQPRPSAREPRT